MRDYSKKSKTKNKNPIGFLFCFCSRVAFFDFCPVHHFPKIFKILCASISSVNVVGMFPNITYKNWRVSRIHCDTIRITSAENFKFPFWIDHEPSPSRAKLRHRLFVEFFFELCNCSPLFFDNITHFWRKWCCSCWCQIFKIEYMIPNLRCIVINHAARCTLNNRQKWFFFKFCIYNEFIEIVNISLKMFTIMIFKGFARNMWFQSVNCIRKFG